MDLVTRMKKTEEKLKKAFRLKLLELANTRTKKTSPDMSNFFYVVMAGHDKVSDTSRATKCRLKIKAPSLQTKSLKIDGPFEKMSFSKNRLKISTKKK